MGFPDSSVGKESACNAGDPGSIPGSGRSSGKGIGYPLQYSWASFVAQLRVKNPPAMRETWVGKIPGEGKGYPLQYSGLENSMDCIVHGVAKSWTQLRTLSDDTWRIWLYLEEQRFNTNENVLKSSSGTKKSSISISRSSLLSSS